MVGAWVRRHPGAAQRFAVAQKVIVPHSDALRSDPDLADFQADLDAAYFDGSAYCTAYVISPRDTRPPEQPPETFAFIVEHIDVEAWQRYFDSFVPMLSALVSGPAESLPAMLTTQALQILGMGGAQVSGLSLRQID